MADAETPAGDKPLASQPPQQPQPQQQPQQQPPAAPFQLPQQQQSPAPPQPLSPSSLGAAMLVLPQLPGAGSAPLQQPSAQQQQQQQQQAQQFNAASPQLPATAPLTSPPTTTILTPPVASPAPGSQNVLPTQQQQPLSPSVQAQVPIQQPPVGSLDGRFGMPSLTPAGQQPSALITQQQQQQQLPGTPNSVALSQEWVGSSQGPVPVPANAIRPLNVKDALSYLDQVKIQFNDQPEVYNQFLDIMKDFKSQSIDTPGVIQRVSNLFQGHRNLIQGFNTFLPPGFKIDLPADESLPPVVTHTAENGVINSYQLQQPTILQHLHHRQQTAFIQQQPVSPPSYQQQQQPPSPNTLAAMQANQQQQQQRKQPVEFNHAINYVNKIKTRFNAQPETYKSFLEILHTYQKEQKSIKEVYDQVAILFQSHNDLLQEFSQFLPEAVPHQQAANAAAAAFQNRLAPPPSAPATAEHFGSHGSKKGSKSSSSRQYKRTSEKAGLSQLPVGNVPKKSKVRHGGVFSPQGPTGAQIDNVGQTKDLNYGRASQLLPLGGGFGPGTNEELEFFDSVKRTLNDKTVYSEFLKCLNLFSQEIVTKQELVNLVSNFLAKAPKLFEWFKEFIGYKESPELLIPDRKPASSHFPQIDYNLCKRYGPSYRAMPKAFQRPQSSGRNELCNEVLNDSWVSFPCWSEDSPFLASRKNIHEEAIYKAEDERYELDHMLELNRATIRNFDAVHERMQKMTPDEAQRYRLGDNLGGTSEVIYYLAIKRVYGDSTTEVIDSLRRHPFAIVPIVLNRLKLKDEEWRKSQREWNKIWRELYNKNYYKALDYQANNFKLNDKKAITGRQLIQEAESLLNEQLERIGDMVSNKPAHQFEFVLSDHGILNDIVRLVVANLDKFSMTIADREKVGRFCKEVFPHLFNVGVGESDTKPQVNGAPSSLVFLYANNTIYVFVRLLQIAYSRLQKMKQISHDAEHPKVANNIAVNLSLQPQPPSDNSKPGFYAQLLDFIENFMDNKLDPNQFEDAIRDMYNTNAFITFTIDKVISAIAKQIQAIVTEEQSVNLLEMFAKEKGFTIKFENADNAEEEDNEGEEEEDEEDQKQQHKQPKQKESSKSSSSSSKQEQQQSSNGTSSRSTIAAGNEHLSYRERSDQVIGPTENCYLVEYLTDDKVLKIRLFARAPTGRVEASSVEEDWSAYVDQYVNREYTAPELKPLAKVFLKRNHVQGDNILETAEVLSNLECKICVNTYKLFYVENTEDYFRQLKTKAFSLDTAVSRSAKFHRWLEGPTGWTRGGADKQALTKDVEALLLGDASSGTVASSSFVHGINVRSFASPAPVPVTAPAADEAAATDDADKMEL